MAVRLDPAAIAEKYARRAGAASQDYVAGVQRVTSAPGAAAAGKAQKALNGYQDAITSGRWAQRVGSVSLQQWQDATVTKGGSRYASGVQAAQPKMQAAMQRLTPIINAAQAKARSMPDATPEQRMQRAMTFMQEMHNGAKRS